MATDTNISQLVINKLTQAQYKAAKDAGNIVETELYMITDGDGGGAKITVDTTVVAGSENAVSGGAVYNAIHTHKFFTFGTTAPSDKNLLWIDTSIGTGVIKFHNGTSWVATTSVWQ